LVFLGFLRDLRRRAFCYREGMPSAYRALVLAVLLLPWSVACGGKSNTNENDDPIGPGGSSNGGAAGNATGGKPTAGNGTGGTAGNAECATLVDDDPLFIGINIINDSEETLFLGDQMATCAVGPLFEVRDAEDRLLTPLSDCRSSCESAMSDDPIGGCLAFCASPQATELKPGESLSTEWNGQDMQLVGLPKPCQSSKYPTAQCDRAASIAPGTFTFSVTAGTKLDCSTTAPNGCGACMASSKGGCVTNGALLSGTLRTAETRVELDGSYGVGPSNGDGSADGAINFVEIRFQGP
jgi:hypothetical protein